jgi:hypothetical protein
VLQPLDLGVIKCYKQLYRKRLVQKAVCLMDAGKDTKKKINALEALTKIFNQSLSTGNFPENMKYSNINQYIKLLIRI